MAQDEQSFTTDDVPPNIPSTGLGPIGSGPQWFGHPRGLSTLFFTEMWERFSYYGMRAILVLFMTAAAMGMNPGLGLSTAEATAIYGLYTFFVYVLALPGGWVADKIWGQKRSVFVGGVIIMLGHISLAIPTNLTFFVGLGLIAAGTGLLKPNVSTMVGDLYPEGGARRDAGFSIFYMGINIGALGGTFLVGLIGENYNFHWGFALAAIGMFLGLVQYKLGWKYLGTAGDLQTDDSPSVTAMLSRRFYLIAAIATAVVIVVGYMMHLGVFPFSIQQVASSLGIIVVALALAYFAYLFILGGLTTIEKKRLVVIIWIFFLAAVFWMGFEQAGSSLNLFARDLTNRQYGDFLMPASWLQNINPIFIIIFAPIFGSIWVWLSKRNANPSIPVKFAMGLFGLSAGFFVIAWGAANASPDNLISPSWLIVTYFFHTAGELCLSPVGLSSITKLAPKGRVGQMMGIWFIGAALGNLFAGITAGQLETLPPDALFMNVAKTIGIVGLIALVLSPFIKKLTGGIE